MTSLWAIYGIAVLWALNGMSSRIFNFISLSPNQNALSTPTYLFPESSDRRHAFSVCRSGGRLVLLPCFPCAPPPPILFLLCIPPTWTHRPPPHPAPLPQFCHSKFFLEPPPPATFPVSSVGSPISATIEFPILWLVQDVPADTYVSQHHITTLLPQGHM